MILEPLEGAGVTVGVQVRLAQEEEEEEALLVSLSPTVAVHLAMRQHSLEFIRTI